MRIFAVVLGLVALCGCGIDRDGAVSATIAHYDRGGQKDGLVVYLATKGDAAKLEQGKRALLQRGGVDFLILPDTHREGNKMVSESAAVGRDDFLTVRHERMAARARAFAEMMMRYDMKPSDLDPLPEITVLEQGEETVAGHAGTLYWIGPSDGADIGFVEIVLSRDAALAPVGRMFAKMIAPTDAVPQDEAGREDPMAAAVSRLSAEGTVLRYARAERGRTVAEDLYRLTLVEKSWTDPARFNLPVRSFDLEGLRSNQGTGTLFQGSDGFERGDAI
ncbi:hypothetical protein [Stakelama tenebrarum]|uniref:Uncharacterized protein n=1 Tax=Stakelama tenebrarum TaxID=2711215 RepID=A0A6G6Y0M0_9SPHN|nr:hypothetical protein [Sphingosinithalassobacter tenebrarum]QIG78381.1 hypothetical protein G5C33_00275 [Sphingosinithalassobacter tenebrarum]